MRERLPVKPIDAPPTNNQPNASTRDETGRDLLAAIRNSTTRMDQIVLRRIGPNEAARNKLK